VSLHTVTASCELREVDEDVAVVAIVQGPGAGVEHPFTERTLVVGSGDEVGLRLEARGVSRLHCELISEGGLVRIRDLGSKNGCWVGGCRIEEGMLTAGTRVRIGESAIEVRVDRRRRRKAVWAGPDRLGDMHGSSQRMHELFTNVERVVGVTATVLITGESGTGKELVARALHDLGQRSGGPFVVLDGAALSSSLSDVELFGHARGAFTGAVAERAGAFERADGGTLFLDEVGEIGLDIQAKLLRAVETKSVQRVGDRDRRAVDVRLIAATHRPLRRMVNEGTFREDLYFRLSVVELDMPPLRERGADVRMLARQFVEDVAPGSAEAAAAVEKGLDDMAGYRWPGNVRELRSFVRRVSLLGPDAGRPALIEDGSDVIRADLPFDEAREVFCRRFDRDYLVRLLDECRGNASEVARRAGISRTRLYQLFERYGLRDR
jgi:DNA-binding NtrC family response regulator